MSSINEDLRRDLGLIVDRMGSLGFAMKHAGVDGGDLVSEMEQQADIVRRHFNAAVRADGCDPHYRELARLLFAKLMELGFYSNVAEGIEGADAVDALGEVYLLATESEQGPRWAPHVIFSRERGAFYVARPERVRTDWLDDLGEAVYLHDLSSARALRILEDARREAPDADFMGVATAEAEEERRLAPVEGQRPGPG